MRIAWFSEKSMDQSIDHASWTEMTRLLQSMGHEVQLYTGFRKQRLDFGLGPSIHYLFSIKKPVLARISFSLSMGLALLHVGLIQKVDVIIVHPQAFPAYAGFLILKKLLHLKSRLILDVRTLPVEARGLRGALEKAEFSLAMKMAAWGSDGMTFITPFMKEVLTNQYGFNALPSTWWSSGAKRAWLQNEYIMPPQVENLALKLDRMHAFVLIYHGAMSANRGLDHLIRAFADRLKHHPQHHLILLGRGPIRKELIALCHRLKCEAAVTFIDTVPHEHVRAYLALADVGVVPLTDRLEWRVSSPLKLLEYMAVGLPVVLSTIEAHENVAQQGQFAFYYPPGDWRALSMAIDKAFAQRASLPEWGNAGRLQIKNHYTWHRQAERLELFLQDL